VAVLDIGSSRELWRRTHVARTATRLFQDHVQGGVAAGACAASRRPPEGALAWCSIGNERTALRRRGSSGVGRRLKENSGGARRKKTLEKDARALEVQARASQGAISRRRPWKSKDESLAARSTGADAKTLPRRRQAERQLKSAATVLGSSEGGK